MRALELVGGAVEWRGAAWLAQSNVGVSPQRVASRYLDQLDDVARARVGAASGVHIAMRTDADVIELACCYAPLAGVAAHVAVADLVVDGDVAATSSATGSPVARGASRHVFRFDVPVGGLRLVELWPPHDGAVTVESVRVPTTSLAEPPDSDSRRRWVHHGSSISHGGEASSPARIWPAIVARELGLRLTNLGFAGECMLDQFAARTIRDAAADAITLELGVNIVNGATMRERVFVSALHGFLDTIRDVHERVPIMIVSPILFPVAEDRPGPTPWFGDEFVAVGEPADVGIGALSVRRVRDVIAEVVDQRVGSGDHHLHLCSGLELLGHDDAALLVDGLHPGGAGHELIGMRFADVWRKRLHAPSE